MNCGTIIRNLNDYLLWIATSCFNGRCMQRQSWGRLFWLSSDEVLVYEYQCFEDDLWLYIKPLKRLKVWGEISK